MNGLTEKDLRILAFYAKERNRELYWNYLAQIEGENGYGLLAAGVVRHDNMPGKTANLFADHHAREHNGKVLTEREWDNFGVDLIRRDFALREHYHSKQGPERALHLPVAAVQKAHDDSFDNIGVDRNAWTPRQVLEAARQHGGEQEAEDLWRIMRNNGFMGMGRGGRTLTNVVGMENMSVSERSTYLLHMARAYLMSTQDLPHVRPDEIGQEDHSFTRNLDGSWTETLRYNMPFGMSLPATREVTDPDRHRELEDTWHLRMEREAARKRFHPEDPGVIVPSPHPLADLVPRATMPTRDDDPMYADLRRRLPMDISNDKVAQLTCEVRRQGLRNPDYMHEVYVQDHELIVQIPHQEVFLSLQTVAPPKEESMALVQQMDEMAMQQAMERDLVMQQQMAMEHRGPVMRR